jgi:hypothetical protein
MPNSEYIRHQIHKFLIPNKLKAVQSTNSKSHLRLSFSLSCFCVTIHNLQSVLYMYLIMLTTEYTELQPLLSGVHSVMRVKLVLAGAGGGCTPTPSHCIYPHQ